MEEVIESIKIVYLLIERDSLQGILKYFHFLTIFSSTYYKNNSKGEMNHSSLNCNLYPYPLFKDFRTYDIHRIMNTKWFKKEKSYEEIWTNNVYIYYLFLLTACGSNTYEIDEEVNLAFSGYDEHGTATVSLDRNRLFSAITDGKEFKDRNEALEFESIISDVEIQVAPNENLKNGDEVELELLYDEDNALNLNLNLANPKITVEDLAPVKTLTQDEIFAGIDVQFEGVSPFLNVTITENTSSDIPQLFTYSIPNQYVKSGDEIQVTAEPNSDLISSGYQADDADFIYTAKVKDAKQYVENWDQLNDKNKEDILQEIQDVVTAQIDSKIEDSFNSIYEKGDYITYGSNIADSGESVINEQHLLFAKGDALEDNSIRNSDPINGIRFVYKNEVTFNDKFGIDDKYINKTKDYFSVVGANHLIIDEDGNLDRNEIHFNTFSRPDLDKKTVKNETLFKLKDMYTIDDLDNDDHRNEDYDEADAEGTDEMEEEDED